MVARTELRRRRASILGVALVIGILGGGAIATAAGARRTMSAYPRFVERYAESDVTVTFPDQERGFEALRWVRARPEVRYASGWTGFPGSITVRGSRISFPTVLPLVRMDAIPSPSAGVKVIEGRTADPDASHEVLLNYALADRLDLGVGDRLRVSIASGFGLVDKTDERDAGEFTVVGVGARIGTFESATTRGFPTTMEFTPAFFRMIDRADFGIDIHLALRDGADGVAPFVRALRDAGFEPDEIDEPDVFTAGVQGLNRVPAAALWIAAGLLGLLTIAIVGQALSRGAREQSRTHVALAALGVTRAQRLLTELVITGATIVSGALVAIGVAIVASSAFPVGLARIAEPDPGVSVDVAALAIGGASLIVGLLFAALVPTWRAVGTKVRTVRAGRSRTADVLARAHVSPATSVGTRFALGRGSDGRSMSGGAVMGSAVAIAAVVTSLLFVRSLHNLVADPTLAGYTWDAAIFAFDEPTSLRERVARSPGVRDVWLGTGFGEVSVMRTAGDPLRLNATVSEGPAAPAITGRVPTSPDEVAFDTRTFRELGVGVGDTATLAGSAGEYSYTIVGELPVATYPFIGENAGQGATLTLAAAQRADPRFSYDSVFATFEPGVDRRATLNDLEDAMRGHAFAVISSEQATTVRNVDRLVGIPPLLAGLFGLLGAAMLAHALVSTTRRRRRDLAILKTIGFVGRQVRWAVLSGAALVVVVAAVPATPVGIVAGRWGWRAFAEYLTVVPAAIVSPVVPAAVAGSAIVLALVIAALPARAAARTQPAVVLRSE